MSGNRLGNLMLIPWFQSNEQRQPTKLTIHPFGLHSIEPMKYQLCYRQWQWKRKVTILGDGKKKPLLDSRGLRELGQIILAEDSTGVESYPGRARLSDWGTVNTFLNLVSCPGYSPAQGLTWILIFQLNTPSSAPVTLMVLFWKDKLKTLKKKKKKIQGLSKGWYRQKQY